MNTFTKISPQNLNAIFSNLTASDKQIFWIQSCDGSRQLYLSESFEKILGASVETLFHNTKNWWDSIHTGDKQRISKQIAARYASNGALENVFVTRVRTKTKGTIYIKDNNFWICNKQGNPLAMAGIANVIQHDEFVRELNLFNAPNTAKKESSTNSFMNKLEMILDAELKLQQQAFINATNEQTYCITLYNNRIEFTEREAECLYYLLKGYSAKHIARFMEISYRTVEDHTNTIKTKTGFATKFQIVASIQDRETIQAWRFGGNLLMK
ncbi:MAG: hypothetical protein COB50_04055 [Thiotrichales bacterium]|nr:MAG: hypothetical protein COB50_04055 [Thiotrichales bacterium]